MSFDRFVRRLHLHLALLLSPWFLMYGISALFLAHQGFGEQLGRAVAGPGYQEWSVRFEVDHADSIRARADDTALRAFGARALAAHDLDCSYSVRFADASHISVYCFSFRGATRLTYDLESRRLLAEDRRMRIDSILGTFHARAGYLQEPVLVDLWAIVVDIVGLSLLVWSFTGLVMWWRRPGGGRTGGAVALAAGCASFLFFVLGL